MGDADIFALGFFAWGFGSLALCIIGGIGYFLFHCQEYAEVFALGGSSLFMFVIVLLLLLSPYPKIE